jgi:hypothetical protein
MENWLLPSVYHAARGYLSLFSVAPSPPLSWVVRNEGGREASSSQPNTVGPRRRGCGPHHNPIWFHHVPAGSWTSPAPSALFFLDFLNTRGLYPQAQGVRGAGELTPSGTGWELVEDSRNPFAPQVGHCVCSKGITLRQVQC